MDLTALDLVWVGGAAVAAGLVNALAGGGTLISFPVLTAVGVPALAANVTNTVALCPGFLGGTAAQWADLRGQGRRAALALPAGALGGVLGGLLLLNTEERVFQMMVPYLILGASFLLAVQVPVRTWLLRRAEARGHTHVGEGRAAVAIGVASIYGGYFGAGLGVILLATIGLLIDDTLTRLNALKQAISFVTNVAAAVFFVFSGEVVWPAAAVMAVGALVGGSLGGRLAGRIAASTLRRLVVAIGLVAAGFYFTR
jgi:uncharacterized membrane protein YfcA